MLTVLYIEHCTLYAEQPLNKREKRGGDKVKGEREREREREGGGGERERERCSLCCTLNPVLCTMNSLVFRKILMQDYLCACVCERDKDRETQRKK